MEGGWKGEEGRREGEGNGDVVGKQEGNCGRGREGKKVGRRSRRRKPKIGQKNGKAGHPHHRYDHRP